MDPAIWASIVAVVGAAAGGLVQWLRSRSGARVARSSRVDAQSEARYDNLQQDLDSERTARQSGEVRLNQEIVRLNQIVNVLGQDIRIRDDYIMQLRQHISDGKVPPPPVWPVSLTKGYG